MECFIGNVEIVTDTERLSSFSSLPDLPETKLEYRKSFEVRHTYDIAEDTIEDTDIVTLRIPGLHILSETEKEL